MTPEDKTRLCIQYDDHPRVMSSVLCALLEHQSLVDIAIRCGNNTMHAHKCILAANSPYFREQLENNPGTEQIIINGLDYMNFKSLMEFIYCGETTILESHLKYIVAAAKLFQIRGLQALCVTEESVFIPPPIFINEKAKYCTGFGPFALGLPSEPMGSKLQDTSLSGFENEENYLSTMGQPLETIDYSELNTSMIPTPMLMTPEEENPCDLSDKPPEEKNKEDFNNNNDDLIKDDYTDLQDNVDLLYNSQNDLFVRVSENILREITNDDHLQFPVFDQNTSGENPKGDENKYSGNSYKTFNTNQYPLLDAESANQTLDAILLNMETSKKPKGSSRSTEGDTVDGNVAEIPVITELDVPKNIHGARKDTKTNQKLPGFSEFNMNINFYENMMFEAANYFAETSFPSLRDSTEPSDENSDRNFNGKGMPDSSSCDPPFDNSEEEY